MNRILLGDNQFFGVNHASEEKARQQLIRFQDDNAIIRVLQAAYSEGIHGFMCTTHERLESICPYFRDHQAEYPDLSFYPCMPYAHKYANAVTEHGMIGAVGRLIPDGRFLDSFVKGSLSVLTADMRRAAQLLIDMEMKAFRGLRTPVIFLQNIVTDLLLGLGCIDAFRMFAEHVESYGAEPGFITMNMPRLLDALDDVDIPNPIVCSNINQSEFRMCGGSEQYGNALAVRRFRPVAMSIFASGSISPRQAISYVAAQKGVQAVVFGASSLENIRQTKSLLDELMPQAEGIP